MLNELKNIIDRNADKWNKELYRNCKDEPIKNNLKKIKIRINDTEE